MPKHDIFDFDTHVETPVGASGMSDALLKEVLDARAKLATRMLSGACKSMESYAEAVGGYRQLTYVLNHAQRLADKLGPAITDNEESIED